MARSILSLGMFSFLARAMAERRRGFDVVSPPPTRAAMEISRMSLVKTRPRLASVAAFLCLIVAHLECPDIHLPQSEFGKNPVPQASGRRRLRHPCSFASRFCLRNLRILCPASLAQGTVPGASRPRGTPFSRPGVWGWIFGGRGAKISVFGVSWNARDLQHGGM